MVYLEQTSGNKRGWTRVFSDVDDERELENFRCTVRAPRAALKRGEHARRPHLLLYSTPRERAFIMLPAKCVHATTIERIAWERTQPQIVARWPEPFIA